MAKRDPFKYFKINPGIIRLAVMMYVRFPLTLRYVEDFLYERGIDVSHETVRSGGTDLALYLLRKFTEHGQIRCDVTRACDGILMRFSRRAIVSGLIFGER